MSRRNLTRNSPLNALLLTVLLLVSTIAAFTFERQPLWRTSEATSHRHAKVIGIPAGQRAVVAELEGPAVINHIWVTVKSIVPPIQGMLVLRVWWDGEAQPSVEVPLGDFFGVGYGKERTLKTARVEMFPAGGEHHSALNTYWEMLFRESARFEIENRSFASVSMFFIQVDYEKPKTLPEDTLYFHAQYRRENPVRLHAPYTILEATGRGQYVGTIMNYHLLGPGAWVEGGQSFYVDGEAEPSLPGTGAEDYFGHGWGFRFEESALLHGTSLGPEENKMTAYRFHLPDPVRFKRSIRATMRCHGWDVGDRQDDYSTVALWYQTEPHAPFPELPPVDFDLLEVPERFRHNPLELIEQAMKTLPFQGENLSLRSIDYRASGHFDIDGIGAMAFDDDPGTKWCEIENPNAHWLALDLGGPKWIEGFSLLLPSAIGDSADFDVTAFVIETGESLEGPWKEALRRDYSNLEEKKQQPSPGVLVLPLDSAVESRFVRLSITKSCPVDPICRIQEFQVWGTEKR